MANTFQESREKQLKIDKKWPKWGVITEGLHVEEVTVYRNRRNLHGRSEAETCKLDNGRGEAEFIIVGIRSLLRHGTRYYTP